MDFEQEPDDELDYDEEDWDEEISEADLEMEQEIFDMLNGEGDYGENPTLDDDWFDPDDLENVTSSENAARFRKRHELAEGNLSVAELKDLGKSDYDSYLLTPHWLKISEEARQRAGYTCQEPGCGKRQWKEHKLDVHHLTYDHLGEERPEDLLVLCHRHHKKYHPDK